MTKKILTFFLAVLLTVSVCGCGTPGAAEEEPVMRLFTDSAGRTVEIPENITKVAVTGQLAQIVVFSIAPDKLVAVASSWSDDAGQYLDDKYLDLPVLGQLYGGSSELNVEELARVAPQVVIDVGETKIGIGGDMDSIEELTGIPAVHINAEMFSMDETYYLLGELLGESEKAEILAEYCRNTYDRTIEITDKVGGGKVSALYCMGDLGCNVICRDSYHSTVIDLLTDNAAVVDNPSSKGTGNEVDMEQLYLWDPDVIFFAPNSMYEYAAGDPEWTELTAIKNNRYYEVPYGIYNWMGFPPSVQRYLGMVWMAKVLYPEYAAYDMYEEVRTFYDLFFHCEVTGEQYEELVRNSVLKMEDAA